MNASHLLHKDVNKLQMVWCVLYSSKLALLLTITGACMFKRSSKGKEYNFKEKKKAQCKNTTSIKHLIMLYSKTCLRPNMDDIELS